MEKKPHKRPGFRPNPSPLERAVIQARGGRNAQVLPLYESTMPAVRALLEAIWHACVFQHPWGARPHSLGSLGIDGPGGAKLRFIWVDEGALVATDGEEEIEVERISMMEVGGRWQMEADPSAFARRIIEEWLKSKGHPPIEIPPPSRRW